MGEREDCAQRYLPPWEKGRTVRRGTYHHTQGGSMRFVVHPPHTQGGSMRLVVQHSHTQGGSMRLVVHLPSYTGRHVCASLSLSLTHTGRHVCASLSLSLRLVGRLMRLMVPLSGW